MNAQATGAARRIFVTGADGFLGRGHAGTVHQPHQFAQCDCCGDHRLRIGFVADIAFDKRAADVPGDGFAFVNLHVGHHHASPLGGEHAGRAFAQARSSAGHDKYLALNLHEFLQKSG